MQDLTNVNCLQNSFKLNIPNSQKWTFVPSNVDPYVFFDVDAKIKKAQNKSLETTINQTIENDLKKAKVPATGVPAALQNAVQLGAADGCGKVILGLGQLQNCESICQSLCQSITSKGYTPQLTTTKYGSIITFAVPVNA